jgi:hypothetical protein
VFLLKTTLSLGVFKCPNTRFHVLIFFSSVHVASSTFLEKALKSLSVINTFSFVLPLPDVSVKDLQVKFLELFLLLS